MGFIQRETHDASADLTGKRGCYPAWGGSDYHLDPWDSGPHLMRNTAPTTIAPTGTISIIAGCSSGIEPLYALAYTRNVMDSTELMEFNPAFKQAMIDEGLDGDANMRTIAAYGSVSDRHWIPEGIKDLFRTSHEIALSGM